MKDMSFLEGLSTAQRAVFFTRMCALVDQAVLGVALHGRPLTAEDLVNELAEIEGPEVCLGLAPNIGGFDSATRPSPEYILFGDIHGRAPEMPRAFRQHPTLISELTELLKLPESLTLKSVSQGTKWRRKLKEWGYSVSFKPDGFGKVLVTIERHGRSLTLVQGNTLPYPNPIAPGACLDRFVVQDLRAAGALIEHRN